MPPGTTPRRRWRVAPLVHSGAALVMLFVLLPLILQAAQAAPPAIAEFAPQVQRPIHDAPLGQSSSFGSGAGDGIGPATTPTPAPTAAPAPTPLNIPKGATVRKCVGEDARQVEDPQSPPCVPFWDPKNNNGGATSFGVTASTITVAVPQWYVNNVGDAPALVNFFNDRFEFYGRKIVLVPFPDTLTRAGPVSVSSPPAAGEMDQDATFVHDQVKAFADLGYPWEWGAEGYFYDSLASKGIISIEGMINGLPTSDEAHLAAHAPYEWNYVPTPDVVLRNLAEVVCKQLQNKPPKYAGSPTKDVAQKRVFGIMRGIKDGFPPFDDSALMSQITACTGVAPQHIDYTASANSTQAEISTAINQFITKGVTTVICVCHPGDLDSDAMPAAQGQSYYPEWLVHNVIGQDGSEGMFLSPTSEAQHAFGIRSLNKELPVADTPYIWAVQYTSPSNPKPPYQNTINYWEDWFYHDLFMLASGIQQAGAKLTPQTFQDGLFRTQFPNTKCGNAPYFQACVGFAGGTHTMQKTFGMIWWDPNQQNPGGATGYPGNYCDVDRGLRYSLGSWPAEDHYGQYPCN